MLVNLNIMSELNNLFVISQQNDWRWLDGSPFVHAMEWFLPESLHIHHIQLKLKNETISFEKTLTGHTSSDLNLSLLHPFDHDHKHCAALLSLMPYYPASLVAINCLKPWRVTLVCSVNGTMEANESYSTGFRKEHVKCSKGWLNINNTCVYLGYLSHSVTFGNSVKQKCRYHKTDSAPYFRNNSPHNLFSWLRNHLPFACIISERNPGIGNYLLVNTLWKLKSYVWMKKDLMQFRMLEMTDQHTSYDCQISNISMHFSEFGGEC